MTLVTRGLAYPATRRGMLPRETLTKARLVLLEGAGEDELTRFVKSRAKLYGWNGWHLRDSEGVIESVHSLRLDGFSDGLGIPDWYWWHEDLAQSFWSELKGASGVLGKYQKREIGSMRRAGVACFVWFPRDAAMIEHIFRYGLKDLPV
jgi:hypothetical protein